MSEIESNLPAQTVKQAIQPAIGEVITSLATNNSYTMGPQIGEGNFGMIYILLMRTNMYNQSLHLTARSGGR